MLRARHTDPQFSSGPAGSNFVPPPGRTTFQMRPTMTRMPQNTMYGSSSAGNQGQYNTAGGPGGPGGPQGGPGGAGGQNTGSYGGGGGNFPNQNPNQYPYNMMNQQTQQNTQPQRPPYQMPMRPQNMQGEEILGIFLTKNNYLKISLLDDGQKLNVFVRRILKPEFSM